MSSREPHWTECLAPTILPTNQQIRQLELVREKLGIDHTTFAELVSKSPASLRRMCEQLLARIRTVSPNTNERELLVSIEDFDDLVKSLLVERRFVEFGVDPGSDAQKKIDRILGWYGDGEWFDETIAREERANLAWISEIPPSLRPEDDSLNNLEELRRRYGIPDKMFGEMVLKSPGTTQLMCRQQYDDLRRRRPEATNKELFNAIIRFRFFTTDLADGMTPEAARKSLDQAWRQSIIDSVVEGIESIDDVAKYIVEEYEEFWKYASDPFGINSQIAEMLGYRR